MSLTHRPSKGNLIRAFKADPVPGVSTIVHLGEDYGWGNGYEVYAAASGRVSSLRWSATTKTNRRSGGYGNYFIIDHGNGLTTLYAHQPNTPMLVTLGQHVDGGQHVGTKGNTGNAAGAHLHFEARIKGVPVNPRRQYKAGPALATLAATTLTAVTSKGSRMKPFILFGSETGQDFPYLIDPYTGERSYLNPTQLSVLRESGDRPGERTIEQGSLDTIPKRVGSVDHDGRVL
jgi:hypothetical protein